MISGAPQSQTVLMVTGFFNRLKASVEAESLLDSTQDGVMMALFRT